MSFAAKVLTRRALRRRHLAGLTLALTILIWGALWAVTAYRFNRAMDKALETARTNEIGVNYAARALGGSPFFVHIYLDGLDITGRSGSSLHAEKAVFYLGLFGDEGLSGKLKGGVSGLLKGVPFEADAVKFGFTAPSRPPRNHDRAGLSLWLHPFGLALQTEKPLPFGERIKEAMLDLRVMGAVPDFSDAEAVKAWNEAGGVIELDRVYLNWGPMIVTGTGTMGLDPSLQPEGAFSGRIEGIDAALTELGAKGTINKRQQALLHSSLQVLARPSGLMGRSAPVVPMSLQSGGLYLGPVKLMDVPKLEW